MLTDDLDGDEVPELIVSVIDVTASGKVQGQVMSGDRWVEAISGATGKTVWRYDLPTSWFDLQPSAEVLMT